MKTIAKTSPLLRWCGNKKSARITDEIYELFQAHRRDINEDALYIAPFGGALGDVYTINPDKAFIGDSNILLISLYQAICDGDLVRDVNYVWNDVNNEAIFKSIRERFNKMKSIVADEAFGVIVTEDRVSDLGNYFFTDALNWAIAKGGSPTAETLDMIKVQCCVDLLWLNRAGFNGLYRENQAGNYNVPIGRRAKSAGGGFNDVNIPDFAAYCDVLRKHDFYCGDYSSLETAFYETYGDVPFTGNFIYSDPIYFGSGAMYGSLPMDYEHLAKMSLKWHRQGNSVCISNANTREMVELYSDLGFNIIYTTYKQTISCESDSRGDAEEILAYKMVEMI